MDRAIIRSNTRVVGGRTGPFEYAQRHKPMEDLLAILQPYFSRSSGVDALCHLVLQYAVPDDGQHDTPLSRKIALELGLTIHTPLLVEHCAPDIVERTLQDFSHFDDAAEYVCAHSKDYDVVRRVMAWAPERRRSDNLRSASINLYLLREWRRRDELGDNDYSVLIRCAISSRGGRLLHWLVEDCKMSLQKSFAPSVLSDAIHRACRRGDLNLLRAICKYAQIQPQDLYYNTRHVLADETALRHVHILHWLLRAQLISQDHIHNHWEQLLVMIIGENNMPLAQWLTQEFFFTRILIARVRVELDEMGESDDAHVEYVAATYFCKHARVML